MLKTTRIPLMRSAATAVVLFLLLGGTTQAVTIDWVTVGNPGNPNDTLDGDQAVLGTQTFGSVATAYRIGKYEVTNDQYVEFLNAMADADPNGLYNTNMGTMVRGGITRAGSSGSFTYTAKTNLGNKPVNLVSFYDALRFANWLHNGQPTGAQGNSTTEDGAYTITPAGITANSIVRNGGATVFLTSENEWYKGAYYDPVNSGADASGTTDYWLYSTKNDAAPTAATAINTIGPTRGDIANPGTNVVNYNLDADWNSQNGNVTTVGSAGSGSASFYGTLDQGGNVWEWNESIIGTLRGLRGGSWVNASSFINASYRFRTSPTDEDTAFGFRVASLAVPEPGTLAMCLIGSVMLIIAAWLRIRCGRVRQDCHIHTPT